MATLIPDQLSGTTKPAVLRFFRILKKLPDDYTVWFNFAPENPQFLVLSPSQQAFLIQVVETDDELASQAIQGNLFAPDKVVSPDSLAADELAMLESFAPAALASLRKLLVFPNAREETIDQVVLQRSRESEVRFLGLRQSSPAQFLARLQALALEPIAEPQLYTLRAALNPESLIPSVHRPTLIEREQACREVPVFLDLDQEKLFKHDLLAPPPGEELLSTSRLVTGPAGSGKTLVLLHRAIHAARLHASARILVLTHNKPIGYQLRERFQELAPPQLRVAWKTFFEWAVSELPRSRTILSEHKVLQRIAALQGQVTDLATFEPRFLMEEINYLRDSGVANCDEYLELDRKGRATALQKKSREAIWNLLEIYRDSLLKEESADWHEIALRFYRFSSKNPERFLPKYDFIFIDEAQFFAKIWFTPVLAALEPGGQLFLSADPTQGFLKRRQSWRDLGIEVVGRTHRLERVYRSTRPIVTAARQFFLTRLASEGDDEKEALDAPDLPQEHEIASLPDGEQVHRFAVAHASQSVSKAAELVTRQLEKSPHLRGHILVIQADATLSSSLKRSLETTLGAGSVRDLQAAKSEPQPEDPLCLCSSLNAATGLEATSVILLGLDSLLEKESDPTLSPESVLELRKSQTRLIYVALTRAVARLSIVTTDCARWERLLGIDPRATPRSRPYGA